MVLRLDRSVPVLAEVIEERLHQRSVDLRERQAFQGDAALVATESQQQREHVAVGLDRVRAQISLRSHVVR